MDVNDISFDSSDIEYFRGGGEWYKEGFYIEEEDEMSDSFDEMEERMDLSETVIFDIEEIINETEKAWQIELKNSIEWFPKSQCRVVGNKLYVPQWLANNKGLDYSDIDFERK